MCVASSLSLAGLCRGRWTLTCPPLPPPARSLIKEGGDYDRRNRLSLYRAQHLLSIRQFSAAAPLLIDALTTFAATELMTWDDLVGLAVLAGVVGLERGDVKAKIIDSPEVRQSFPERPVLEDFTGSLYACDYARFFRSLGASSSFAYRLGTRTRD